ncbi:cell division protein FtsB [Azospirillum fermentarium]|uniref:FtsB family cell division protein n=1 Tax=Azospirillum fermentarium TaxID=1233114 RepID=UPI00222659DF|nr:septum formation initiator family protein [Azospirillum fermentarium]MCW2246447.1 cell division protein FtsB [Azospirillum fermentarium]
MTDVLARAARSVLRQVIGPAIGASIVAYFIYYAVQGDRGVIALRHLQSEITEAQKVLDDVKGERMRMERRAQLLRDDNLDPDMLEERARAMLNLTHPNEVIVPLPALPKEADSQAAPKPLAKN